MFTEKVYITSHCSITGNRVVKDDREFYAAVQIPRQEWLVAVYQFLQTEYPRFYKMDQLSRVGWLTAEVLLRGSFDKTRYAAEDVGLVMANKNSSLDTDIRYFDTIKTMASPALFVYTLPNIVLGEICIRHGFKGENDFFISAAFDPAFTFRYVQHLFETGAVQACICGWADALDNEYQATLFLLEKQPTKDSLIFTQENIANIYQTAHG